MDKEFLRTFIDLENKQLELNKKKLDILETLYSVNNWEESCLPFLNQSVFNDRSGPLFNENVNVFDLTIPSVGLTEADASLAGRFYTINFEDQTFNNSRFFAFNIINPSNSNTNIQIGSLRVTTASSVTIDTEVTKSITSFTPTGSFTPINTNVGSSNSSVATVNTALNVVANPVTGGTVFYSFRLASDAQFSFNGSITVPPGNNLVIKFQNTGTNTTTIDIVIEFWEFR